MRSLKDSVERAMHRPISEIDMGGVLSVHCLPHEVSTMSGTLLRLAVVLLLDGRRQRAKWRMELLDAE